MTTLWQAAALGLMERVAACFSCDPAPDATAVTQAFWCACHGGQLPAAEYLLTRSAELNWVGWDGLTALDVANRSGARELVEWLRQRGARSATSGGETLEA